MTRNIRDLGGQVAERELQSKPGRRRYAHSVGRLVALVVTSIVFVVAAAATAHAQDVNTIVDDLESQGWHIEDGGDGAPGDFADLVSDTDRTADDQWYFVSLSASVPDDFAETIRDATRPTGNVVVFYYDDEDFASALLATPSTESVEFDALAPIVDPGWQTPDEFMVLVVDEYEDLTAGSSSSSTGSTSTGSSSSSSGSSSDSGSSSSGGGVSWLWLGVPVGLIGGGMWFSGRRRRQKADDDRLEAAQKLRAAIQTELDELANDVIVLSSPVDLSEKDDAVTHYREATATFTAISEEIPDLAELDSADLDELSALGARVAHARWQMDAAEAIVEGEPIPDKPEVEAPPPPKTPAPQAPAQQRPTQLPPRVQNRAPRARTRSTGMRRNSGGGLLDILIGAGSMMGGSRRGRGGGMFGGASPSRRPTSTTTARRPGGGVFGSSSGRSPRSTGSTRRTGTRRTGRRRSSSSSSSRSSSRSRGTRRSSSRGGRARR